jgi:hypothetical protein
MVSKSSSDDPDICLTLNCSDGRANLSATQAVDESVRRVAEQVVSVDDRMTNVNDKVTEVIHGEQIIFRRSRNVFNLERAQT